MNSLFLLLALGGAAVPEVPAPVEAPTSIVEIFVFRDGAPVPGVEVRLGPDVLGVTDEYGGYTARIPSGRARLELWEDSVARSSLDLLTDDEELVQLLVTLRPDGPPEYTIESSGAGSPLERTASSTRAKAAVEVAQPPGALVGVIVSVEARKPVAGARLYFSGSEQEVVSDAEGRYQVELPPGVYSISVIHPDFATQTLEDIRVISAREVTANMELAPAGIRLEDYVVTAPYVEGSIASVLEQQRETSNVVEVLGADQMNAAGDRNAADALKRVTGLTVEDGKFVLVRGQPSRYTLTLWNGSPLPSPEPLKRVVPLDLFPTGVLSGIEVQKSYSADKPGSFGAGLINLQTRGARADESYFELSLSTAANTISAFQDGHSYQGGGLDFLGFDDGTRALPAAVDEATNGGFLALDALDAEARDAVARQFPNHLGLKNQTMPPDFGLSVAAGHGFDLPGGGTFGAAASMRYATGWRQQERTQRSFSKRADGSLQVRDELNESRTDFNASLGGLLTLEAEWAEHSVQANTFIVHQAQQQTQLTTGLSTTSDELDIQAYLLSWIERLLIAQQLAGKSDLGFMQAEWRGMIAIASRDAPDRRNYAYAKSPDQDRYFARGDTGVARRYDTVDDLVASVGLDLTFPIVGEDKDWLKVRLKTGGALEHSKRDALTQLFLWRVGESGDRSITDPEVLYDPANTGTTINFQDLSNSGADDYAAKGNVFGAYLLGEVALSDSLRLLGGARWETAKVDVETFQLASRDDSGEREVKKGGFDQSNLLPFLSATWQVIEALQLRSAYSRTVSRPIFNELSESTFYDPDTGDQYIGKADLAPTRIDGFDLRFEWYPSSTESLSLGGFAKLYTDPIETAFVQRAGTVSVSTFQNAKDARVLGLEVGGRFEFARLQDFIGELDLLEGLFLQANLAVMTSEVTLLEQGTATNVQRPLDGQAAYVLNVQGGFSGEAHDVVVAFNQVGRRLFRAGSLDRPDVFLEAIPRLDVTWTWRLEEWISVRASASNLLNPNITSTQGDEVWRQYRDGMTFRLSATLSL